MARGTFEIRVLDPFRLDAEALQLGRGHVLQGVSNPRATVLANFMKPVEAGGGKVNWMTYSLLNVEEHQGPIISHLDDVFFNTGGQGQISRAEVRSILDQPLKIELTTFLSGPFKVPPSLAQLMSGGAPP
jgi:hypothetical protein